MYPRVVSPRAPLLFGAPCTRSRSFVPSEWLAGCLGESRRKDSPFSADVLSGQRNYRPTRQLAISSTACDGCRTEYSENHRSGLSGWHPEAEDKDTHGIETCPVLVERNGCNAMCGELGHQSCNSALSLTSKSRMLIQWDTDAEICDVWEDTALPSESRRVTTATEDEIGLWNTLLLTSISSTENSYNHDLVKLPRLILQRR